MPSCNLANTYCPYSVVKHFRYDPSKDRLNSCPLTKENLAILDLDLVSFVPFFWEFSRVDILYYGVHPGRGYLIHLTYPGIDN